MSQDEILKFIETSIFTFVIARLMTDEDYRALQWKMVLNPTKGVLIPGGGGLRKVRWGSTKRQKGSRGGLRIIYYVESKRSFYMIYAYSKNSQQDLTRNQLKELKAYIKSGVL